MNDTGDVGDPCEHRADAEVLFLFIIEQIRCHLFWICMLHAGVRRGQGSWKQLKDESYCNLNH